MIIGIDASRANRQIKTGTEWYSYYLIEELKKITVNDSNRYFLYTDKSLRGGLARLPKNWQEKILHWPPRYLWTKIRLSWEMLRNKPDLLFIPSHTLPIFFPKKTVMTVHDLGYEKYPEAYSFFARYHLRQSYKFAARQATKIIVPTEFTKRELISLYNTKPEKIEVVHLSYNDKIFKPIEDKEGIEKTLARYKIKKPYLLFIGRIEVKKGIGCLLESLAKLEVFDQKFQLVIVGESGYGYKAIKLKIQNFPKQNKFAAGQAKFEIRELGYLSSEEDRACLYGGAEAFVFPSLYEGFGIPVLEAMACGTPVVASDIEPLKEVSSEAALFFKVEDAENLAEKIKGILENQEFRRELIIRGLERVKNFSWRKCAAKTLEILLNCGKI